MNSSGPTKKQHFVPKFYLKNFAHEEGDLQVLDIKKDRMGKPRPYQGLGYEYFYYSLITGQQDDVAQQIEEWFRPMEDFIARRLPRIIEKIEGREQILDSDRYVLAALMSMLWLRTPAMRAQIEKMNKDLALDVERLHGTGSGESFRSESNIDHLVFMTESIGFGGPGFVNMFLGMKWKAYLAKGNLDFITTDSPIVEKWDPPKGFYGTGFPYRDKYFALTPRILLKLTRPCGSTKLKRKTLYKAQDDTVKTLNMILVSNAQEYAYCGRKKELELLLRGKKFPGKLEIDYMNKYEIPWQEWRKRMGKA